MLIIGHKLGIEAEKMAEMLSIEAWGHDAENEAEDEVLSECLKQPIKQFDTVFFSSACIILLYWSGGNWWANRKCCTVSGCRLVCVPSGPNLVTSISDSESDSLYCHCNEYNEK